MFGTWIEDFVHYARRHNPRPFLDLEASPNLCDGSEVARVPDYGICNARAARCDPEPALVFVSVEAVADMEDATVQEALAIELSPNQQSGR